MTGAGQVAAHVASALAWLPRRVAADDLLPGAQVPMFTPCYYCGTLDHVAMFPHACAGCGARLTRLEPIPRWVRGPVTDRIFHLGVVLRNLRTHLVPEVLVFVLGVMADQEESRFR